MHNLLFLTIIESLCQLIEDPPDKILRNFLPLSFMFIDQFLESPTLTMFHCYVNGDILLVNFVLEISKNVGIIHFEEDINLVNDLFFPLLFDGGEGDLFDDCCLLSLLVGNLFLSLVDIF